MTTNKLTAGELTQKADVSHASAFFDIMMIAVLWCLGCIVVNPVGNFPLLDDWSFAQTVRHLLDTGDYRPQEWASMPLVTNVLWAYPFCWLAGFSFTVLRASTLVASLLGIIGAYVLARELRQRRQMAIVIALTLAANPVYCALSYTFMTDVLFTTLLVWATIVLIRNFKSGSSVRTGLGTLLAVMGTLSRQIGLCVPLAFGISLLCKEGVKARTLMRASAPLIVCMASLLAFEHWLAASGRLPPTSVFRAQINQAIVYQLTDVKWLIQHSFTSLYFGLMDLGLFLLPVLILSIRHTLRPLGRHTTVAIWIGITMFAVGGAVRAYYGDGIVMPLFMEHANWIGPSGIGPLTLRDTDILNLQHVSELPPGFWIIVTGLALLGAVLLITSLGIHVISLIRSLMTGPIDDTGAKRLFVLLSAICYLPLPMLTVFANDRYLVPSIPFIAVAIASGPLESFESSFHRARLWRFIACAILLALAAFAISGTRDYLTWNRTRWKALRDLTTKDHIDPHEIDGGYEFNGLLFYRAEYDINAQEDQEKSWWWVSRETYQIGFGAVPGYRVIREYPYRRWLPPVEGRLVVLRKE